MNKAFVLVNQNKKFKWIYEPGKKKTYDKCVYLRKEPVSSKPANVTFASAGWHLYISLNVIMAC